MTKRVKVVKLSKGMRKHRRKEKAVRKKQKTPKPRLALPNYTDFPMVTVKYGSRYCPNCDTSHFRSSRVTVETETGKRQMWQCDNCQTKYRV